MDIFGGLAPCFLLQAGEHFKTIFFILKDVYCLPVRESPLPPAWPGPVTEDHRQEEDQDDQQRLHYGHCSEGPTPDITNTLNTPVDTT